MQYDIILFKLTDGQPIPKRKRIKRRHVQPIENPEHLSVQYHPPRQLVDLYGTNGELRPEDLAKCMIDTYRAMNKHFIPTGYELSAFAKYQPLTQSVRQGS